MSFRKSLNHHEHWLSLVRENEELLCELPREALISEKAFRDYVTIGTHRGTEFMPTVHELSMTALHNLFDFIHSRAHFDGDAGLFDGFQEAFRRCGERR